MSTLIEYLHNYLEERKKHYTLFEGINIQKDYEEEKRLKESYSGREVFELLQNADDASITAKDKVVCFKLEGDRLCISNNGTPFTEESFRAIFFAGMSDKKNYDYQIGEKGLGFRSILNWSDDITIESNHLRVHFSPTVANKFLQELLADQQEFAKAYAFLCDKNHYDPSHIALLEVPSVCKCTRFPEYDTSISIIVAKELREDIESQLTNITPKTLLFLNNLTQIRIETSSNHVCFTKYSSAGKVIIEQSYNDIVKTAEWNTKSSSGEYIGKPYQLCVAWNENLSPSSNCLYCFFPTQETIPLPLLIHGTFDLTPNRNNLAPNSDRNKYMTSRLAELCQEVALSLTATICSYKPLLMLDMNSDNMGYGIKNLDFQGELERLIPKSYLFPTVNNTYINLSKPAFHYTDLNISRILNGEDVNRLLKYCPYPHLRDYIGRLTSKFPDITFATIISKRVGNCKNEGYENYAHLLWHLVSSPKELNLKNIPPLLLDTEDNLIPWDSKIVIPNENFNSLTCPAEIPIKFLNTGLLTALKLVSKSKDESDLLHNFRKFGLQKFSPRMLVETVSEYYYKKKEWTEADVRTFHNIMANLFKEHRYEVSSYKFSGPIYIFSKDGSIQPSSKSYLCSSYGDEITERLYSFDSKKIITPNLPLYRCDAFSSIDIKDYFKWIGVSEYPRITEYPGDKHDEYCSYLFERWGYRKSFNGIDIKTFSDYSQLYQGRSFYKVQDIDCLDEILRNSETETIITWIYRDRNLNKILADDVEDPNSFIAVSMYRYRDRRCPGKDLFSHIKWKIMTSAWLKVKSGKRVAPEICTTSQTITDEFSPLIEKPSINESHRLFKSYSINSRKIEQVLELVGVAKSISEFRTGVIYSVLNRLPEIDISGNKAKSIYRELSTNFNEKRIDTHNGEYVKFIKSGKVFCRDGIYHEIQKTHYLPDKRFADSVTRNFNIISIDPKKSAERIRSIFQIEKLGVDNIQIIGTPTTHPVNDRFGCDIEDFKPYVYLFRYENDQDGSSLGILKDIKFIAVKELSYSFEKEGCSIILPLNGFEFFYDSTRRTVYMHIPSEMTDYDILKEHKQLGAAVRDAFATIFNINADNNNFGRVCEMFTSSIAGREDIVRDQFDDENLSKLEYAEKRLGLTHNYKLSFWKSLVKCVPDKSLPEQDYSDEELADAIITLFPEYESEITAAFDTIMNYNDYSSDINSSQCIVALLKKMGITLEQFNKYAYPQFSLKKLYLSEYSRKRDQMRDIIFSNIYTTLQENPTEQKDFKRYKVRYESMRGTNIPTSLKYDIEKDFSCDLKQTLPKTELNARSTIIDFAAIYSANKTVLVQNLKNICSEDVIDDFINNKEYDSLLYFEDGTKKLTEIIMEKFKQTSQNSYSINTPIRFGNQQISYKSKNELFQKFGMIPIELKSIKTITIKKRSVQLTGQKESRNNSQIGKVSMGKIKKENEIYGWFGEHCVFRFLNEKHRGTNIKVCWVSDNARSAGINPDGGDGQGYDICLKRDGQIIKYIEVKTGDSNAFHITKNEVDTATSQEICGLYDIYVVRNIKNGNPAIEIIETPFKFKKGQSFLSNDKFDVVNDNYTLCYSI